MKRFSLLLFVALQVHAADHVVLMVWDGLRPDSVNETNTPTLARLAREGVFFTDHHSVYITSTEVNGVALATGALPNRNGVLANREYRPNINSLKSVAMESPEVIRKGDEVTHGYYLEAPTLPELLRRSGLRAAVAGTKPVAKLFDRTRDEVAIAKTSSTAPNIAADAETTNHLIGKAWGNGVPQFSLLWLSEPDRSQHDSGVGSPKALAGLRSSDDNLARVLEKLQSKGVRDKTDVFVVSDHGFSTVSQSVNLVGILANAGFSVTSEFKESPKPREILVVGLGGSALFYVIGQDAAVTSRLVEFLQRQDFTGVIFTRRALPGTFTLEAARLNTVNAPDVVVAMRWSDRPSARGVPGLLIPTGTLAPGKGSHSSLSRYDVHNTLIASGPDFRGGTTNDLPSSNADIAPTVLAVLGVKPSPMDGRVLTRPAKASSRTLKAAANGWQQYLRVTECGGAFYIDEGNGSSQVVHSEENRVSP